MSKQTAHGSQTAKTCILYPNMRLMNISRIEVLLATIFTLLVEWFSFNKTFLNWDLDTISLVSKAMFYLANLKKSSWI